MNQLFLDKFKRGLDLPNYNMSDLGSEVAGLICIQGGNMSRIMGSAVLIDTIFEHYKKINVCR